MIIGGGDRAALARLLAGVSPAWLSAVAGEMFEPDQLPADLSWQDTAAVVDRIAAMPARDVGLPPLPAFAARVAAGLTGRLAAAIDEWVAAATGTDPAAPATAARRLRIWGNVPLRNPVFTGRELLLLRLQRALEDRSKASVLPRALHGLGGVGKTQLAVEFAYRYAERYDVVWWIPAEQRSLVLQSLHHLGRHLDIPETADLQQTASLVLADLADSPLRWLLIYDNANDPEDIARLMPTRGGHVILTSRDHTWSEVWDPIQVDIFERGESIELVRKRGEGVSQVDADRLAARLGDLPLALDQAVSCQVATGMSVGDYLSELDRHVRELAKPPEALRTTLVALVRLAIWRLRAHAPAVAELLEMFAFLGPEPISGGLLRRGREAPVSAALRHALRDQVAWDRAVRDLRRYGLAKVDPDQRMQVHRLFQGVLRDELKEEAARRGRSNVQQLLASANPGYPRSEETWPVHAEIGPHIRPAGLIDSSVPDARRVVLDQIRYLNLVGDLEGSRRLGDESFEAWSKAEDADGLGPNGELTLRAANYLAVTLRHLGFNERARSMSEQVLDRFRDSPEFGPDHEFTLNAAGVLAPHLRVAGRFAEALALDRQTVAGYRRVFGDEDEETITARNNLAVNLRMLSDFAGAYRIDAEAVRTWQQVVSENDNRLLFAQANLARDLYGLGRYAEALEILRGILPAYRHQRGAQHPSVLLAGRTLAIALRKVGRYHEALAAAAEHDRDSERRYGTQHEHSLAATMTHANTLRVTGNLAEAQRRAAKAMDGYLQVFGEDHPLTLAAAVNQAIVLRSLGELAPARELDERTHARMGDVLGDAHGFTLCAASGLAHDLALAGEHEAAWRLSVRTLEVSRRARGLPHPYTRACAVNAALDTIAVGRREEGRTLLHEAVAGLGDLIGAGHPETVSARAAHRLESDIEPAPT
ncbi:hypothetical protein Psuf_082340 [Phytohabitans suffuscus]|uniref:Uncharacterized protein n=1 Tax=Phytohabitans suffuscus TaxID=624315 RepID=A0A6F8YYK3_9ACTN|nr:FxSxx-COOH system tetratricopeptide repeat protein [Phytohabitans suffuscus]BCB90921.1 hypothetical protein Psuf_082340 [Phytohabitans suffuscus]